MGKTKYYGHVHIYYAELSPAVKTTMSLVNVLLKFQKLISQISQYFLSKKAEKLLHCKSFSNFFNEKNFSVFGYKVIKYLRS